MRFINIAVLKSLTHFLKRLTPLLKHLTLCISFVFLRTSLCPFSATTLCTSLLISPQSHWGTVSKYSFIVPNHSGTPRLFIVHLGMPSILSVPFRSLRFIWNVRSLLSEGIPNPYRRDKPSFSIQNLAQSKINLYLCGRNKNLLYATDYQR